MIQRAIDRSRRARRAGDGSTRLLLCGSAVAQISHLLDRDQPLFGRAQGLSANVYRSILTAVARGDRTPTGIASRTGRPVSALARPIERLTDAGLLLQIPDLVRARRSTYELADPFISFHEAIVRPNRTRIRRRQQRQVWMESESTWTSQIVGPHFERLCREAMLLFGAEFGVSVTSVGVTSIADAKHRTSHQLDLVATNAAGDIIAIGESKHTSTLRSPSDLERLEHIRSLLPRSTEQTPRILLFSANGFERNLVGVASTRSDVELIDVKRLYGQ